MTTKTKQRKRKLLPHPRFSALLFVLWLLMMESIAISQVFLGLTLALLIPFGTQVFWLENSSVHHPLLVVKYACRLTLDIAKSNLAVALRILGSRKKLKPAFVYYPIALKNDFAITVLASTISLTPGTVSAHISKDRRYLLIHVLHLVNEETMIKSIQDNYEHALKEMFE